MAHSKTLKECYLPVHQLTGETVHAFKKGNQTKKIGRILEGKLVEIGGGLLGYFAIH